MPVIAGIFVGGGSTRMGGKPKGLLPSPAGAALVERWAALARAAGLEPVLVGVHAAYAGLGLPVVADDPPGIGPLGGLAALLARAGPGRTLAIACDLPFVDEALLARLVGAPGDAPIVAPRSVGRWEPLFARYDAARVLPAARARIASGRRSLQWLLDECGARELELSDAERARLRDWDTPADVRRDGGTL